MRLFLILLILLAGAGGSLYLFSEPVTIPGGALPAHTPDPANGRNVFFAAGCSACHAKAGATGDDRLLLAGGQTFETPYGTLHVPNISSDPEHGIGAWSEIDFVNAVKFGVSPEGEHYYPVFPYPSYSLASVADLRDLKGFMDTLPASDNEVPAPQMQFPYNQRRLLGLWKRFAMDSDPPGLQTGADEKLVRGRYLVAALGHCGECHTPRNEYLALDISRWLAGAPNLDGPGWVPNITPSKEGIGDWSEADIATLLETGFTPQFDTVSGPMSAVVRNYAEVPAADREAIAAYLKQVRPRSDTPPRAIREAEEARRAEERAKREAAAAAKAAAEAAAAADSGATGEGEAAGDRDEAPSSEAAPAQ